MEYLIADGYNIINAWSDVKTNTIMSDLAPELVEKLEKMRRGKF